MEDPGLILGWEEEEEGDQYENDLQLAAELGKALLERNRELEAQVFQLQQITGDQALENEYLTRQLEAVRESTEERNRIYEELDRSWQELEKSNQKLVIDAKADKQRIEKLCETVETLEEKNEDLVQKIDDMKAAERERQKLQKQQSKETRRARSLANLPDNKENREIFLEKIHWTYNDNLKNLPLNPYEIEIRNLQELVKQTKAQQLLDRRKKDDLDTEVALLWEENTSLEIKIKILEEDLVRYKKLQDDIQKIKLESGKYCINCGKSLQTSSSSNLEGEVEDEDPKINSEGALVKLEGGGSVYGSLEALNKVAVETKEAMTSIEPVEDPSTAGISILNELETQYQSLFKKYEALLQKGRRPTSFLFEEDERLKEDWQTRLANKEVQTLLKLQKHAADAKSVEGATSDDYDNPPYKTIFRDIFATLKKSRIEEMGEVTITSPSDGPCSITSKSPLPHGHSPADVFSKK